MTVDGTALPWRSFFQAFEIRKSIDEKTDLAVLTFIGVSADAIGKAALGTAKSLTFKWGNGQNVSIPHVYVIMSVDTKYTGNHAMVRVHLCDHRVHMMANSAFSAYPHQNFASIVNTVAGSYKGLPAPVVRQDKSTTQVLQTGANHWSFLNALRTEGAVSQDSGISDYRLYFRGGNELHFHPPDYSQQPYRRIELLNGSIVPETTMRIAPWKPILGGSVGYRVSGYIRDQTQPFNTTSSGADAFKGDPSLSSGATAAAPIPSSATGAFLGKYLRSAGTQSDNLETDSLSSVKGSFSGANSLELTLEGDPGMEPGYLVSIGAKDRNTGQKKEADGLWLVEEVYTLISGANIGKTKIRVSRTNTNTIASSTTPGLTNNTNRQSGTGPLGNYNGASSTNFGGGSNVTKTAQATT